MGWLFRGRMKKMPKDKSGKKKSINKRVKVPTVLQMEALECGAASLGMVLAYYGKYVPLEELRLECGVSRDGSKASNILKAARKYGIQAKGYRFEPAELRKKSFPAIIHWNFNHFVVLEGFKKDKVYLNDPGVGPRTVTPEEFDQSFTGVTIILNPGEDFKKGGKKPSVIRTLRKRFTGAEKALAFAVLTGLALVVPGIIIPSFSRIFIDSILLEGKMEWLSALITGILITAILRGILTLLQQHYLLRLETKMAVSTSSHFIWHVLRLPVEFFSQRSNGDISTRIMSNDRVANFLSGKLTEAVINIIMLVFYFILMLNYDLSLAFICLASAVISMIYMRYTAKKRIDLNMGMLQDRGKIYGTAMAGLQSIETLKATGSESGFFSKWAGYQAKISNGEQSLGVTTQKMLGVPLLLTGLTNALVLLLGSQRILSGYMSMGMLVAFQSLMQSFMTPVNNLIGMGSLLQEVEGDMKRLDDVLEYPVDVAEINHNQEAGFAFNDKLKGSILIQNLSFGYNRLEPPLIEDFRLKLKPGSRVALIGGSGSGKSTIAKVISGLYEPWSGEILFDGMRKDEIPRSVLYNSISVVDQDICMFEGTIKDNIKLWDETISEAEMIRAAKDACIHKDITARDKGYDSMVEEGGRNFSGGQRQRLEIARALVGNPSILIMDEATSALDPKTEQLIDENIRRRGCTCIIIAHRLSTIRDCDEIIVMEKGKIVQRGTHEKMKLVDGPYAKLISMQ